MAKIRSAITFLRDYLGVEEIFFLLGMSLLYLGLSVQFSHAAAQMVCGAVLVCVSILIAAKGSS